MEFYERWLRTDYGEGAAGNNTFPANIVLGLTIKRGPGSILT